MATLKIIAVAVVAGVTLYAVYRYMSAVVVGVVLYTIYSCYGCVTAVAVGVGLYTANLIYNYVTAVPEEEKTAQETGSWQRSRQGSSRSYSHQYPTYSNPAGGNNHDHLKHRHSSKELAEAEIHRMQSRGWYEDTHRLKAYYNPDLDGWFVGNSNRRY